MKPVKKRSADWTKEDIASFWDWQSKNISRVQQYFTASMATGIVRFLKKRGLLKGRVLDYGCGAGHLLTEMIKAGDAEFYGLDFSPDSISATAAKMAGNPRLKQLVLADHLPTSLGDAQFDTITLIETIEHLQDDQLHATMDELFRLLKSRGNIFITTPFNEDLDKHLNFCPFCKSEFHHMQHMQSFDIARLTALGREHGFAVEYCNNIDIEKFKLGAIKYFIKDKLKRTGIYLGLVENIYIKNPNLIAIFSKP